MKLKLGYRWTLPTALHIRDSIDELVASYLKFLSFFCASIQGLFAWLDSFAYCALHDTWRYLRGCMALPWTTALALISKTLRATFTRLKISGSGAPVLAVLVVACVVYRFFLSVFCRIERQSASTTYHMTESDMQDVIARVLEKVLEKFRRELDARDRDAARAFEHSKTRSGSEEELLTRQRRPREIPEATAADNCGDEKDEDRAGGDKQGASKKHRGKKMHRAGRKHRKRSIMPKGDIGEGGGEEGRVEVVQEINEV